MTFKKRLPPIGARPGTLAIPPDSPPPRIHLFDYQGDVCTEVDVQDVTQLEPYVESTRITWVDVQGFGDEAQLRAIAELFGLHPLTLEDLTNVPQRAKSEIHPDHQLIIARAPDPHAEQVEVPQVAFILGRNYLITFQDRYFGFFDPVRERIREGLGPIRQQGPDYLLYALLDILIDYYFPVALALSEQLEDLEEYIHDNPSPDVLEDLQRIRRDLVVVRRVGWPQREALRALLVEPSAFVTEDAMPYLRSTEQHMIQLMEAVDAARDTTSGLIDLYISNIGQKTNEIMKVLTLMASIFIPLTFIAGIYGMNFENMPELQQPNSYFFVLTLMGSVAVGMVVYFRHRGWLGGGSGSRRSRGKG